MGREIAVGLALAGLLETPVGASDPGSEGPVHQAVQTELDSFAWMREPDVERLLRLRRRPAPPKEVRARVRAMLPHEGSLRPTVRQARKLAALQPLLALHGRADDVDIRMFTVGGAAWTGLHARSVLLISKEALDLLDVHELVAVAAHELGHDVVWDDYERAGRTGGVLRQQVLELHCDAVAVLALERLGTNPERLVSAVRKLATHNIRLGWTADVTRCVPLDQRIRFIRTVAERRTELVAPPAGTVAHAGTRP